MEIFLGRLSFFSFLYCNNFIKKLEISQKIEFKNLELLF